MEPFSEADWWILAAAAELAVDSEDEDIVLELVEERRLSEDRVMGVPTARECVTDCGSSVSHHVIDVHLTDLTGHEDYLLCLCRSSQCRGHEAQQITFLWQWSSGSSSGGGLHRWEQLPTCYTAEADVLQWRVWNPRFVPAVLTGLVLAPRAFVQLPSATYLANLATGAVEARSKLALSCSAPLEQCRCCTANCFSSARSARRRG